MKTVDFIIKKTPLVRDILGETLVSLPVKVTGDLSHPTVTPLSPSAVRAGLLGIMKRTVQLPVKIVELLAPGDKQQ